MPSLIELLRKREGCEFKVYEDPVKKNKPTVGIGHLVRPEDKLKVGDEIDEERVEAFFKKDTKLAMAAARKQAAAIKVKDADFVVYLASVNFQLGTKWNKDFKKAWAAMVTGDFELAAAEVRKSKWNTQTPKRVKDFHAALLRLVNKTDKTDEDRDK